MIRNILLVFLLIASLATTAQRTNSSPYSFFGIGDEFNPVTVEQSAMGGIGVAYSHYKYLNFTNPAAYASLRYTTYSFGLLNNKLTIDNEGEKQISNSTSLSYFTLAFPIGTKAGMGFGIQPVSSVGYSLSDFDEDASELTLFSGDGGVSRVYGSFGIKVYKELSIGIEADYKFGTIDNSITSQRADVSLATKYKEATIVRGGSVTLGAQYKKALKDNLILSGGATFKMGNDLDVTGDDYLYSLSFTGTGAEFGRDTISQSSINGKYKLPLKTILGAGLGKIDKWYVGLEYANQDAIQTSGFLNNSSNNAYKYGKSNRISLGGYYLPKINSISSYWQRVTYRAGVRLEKTGLLVDGAAPYNNFSSVDDFGISFGLGLPMKQLSSVNMGFEFGKRGKTSNNLIKENYFNFRLSLSLTDTNWFQKRKID
ncbi:hypothetical protein [Polaribacter butkevichii]|uniref:Outer membrane protein beta-barrel domain-containing protein n=1 Tax=Polaribacter butkevichii TaxID=218490 RepID=A0A2P6CAD9_9FLAO|nr:hypothetical protein [Polaribacter butkevichii]PQJ71872.1 hypothetical protein BTO14_00770 [Polaribacter butkevichii]